MTENTRLLIVVRGQLLIVYVQRKRGDSWLNDHPKAFGGDNPWDGVMAMAADIDHHSMAVHTPLQ